MGKLYGSLFLHANMHYAEIPKERLPELAERSYAPALDLLESRPAVKAALEFSGFTLEWLSEHRPDLLERVRALAARGQVELMGSTYADPILPLIPPDDGERQLRRYLEIHERLFGARPRGLYVQEYALDASVVELVSRVGYEWVVVSSGHYRISKRGLLNSALQRIPPQEEFSAAEPVCRPFSIQGARSSRITGLTWNMPGPNDLFFGWKDGRVSLDEVNAYLSGLGARYAQGFSLIATGDTEFVGDMPPQGSFKADRLGELLGGLTAVDWILPSDYLAQYPPTETVYFKAGAGARLSNLDNWTQDDDNRRLNALCDDARSQVRLAEALIDLADALGFAVAEAAATLKAAREELLLADNSDGRGWKPLPERRLDCYDHALNARDLAVRGLQLATAAVRAARR